MSDQDKKEHIAALKKAAVDGRMDPKVIVDRFIGQTFRLADEAGFTAKVDGRYLSPEAAVASVHPANMTNDEYIRQRLAKKASGR